MVLDGAWVTMASVAVMGPTARDSGMAPRKGVWPVGPTGCWWYCSVVDGGTGLAIDCRGTEVPLADCC